MGENNGEDKWERETCDNPLHKDTHEDTRDMREAKVLC